MLLAIFDTRQPRADEIMLAEGFAPLALQSLLRRPLSEHALFRAAMEQGSAVGAAPAGMGKFSEVLTHTIADDASDQRRWWIILGRRAGTFSDAQHRLAGLLARHWQMDFDSIDRPASGRLWLGGDNRLIHADLWSRTLMVSHPALVNELLDATLPVLRQRWDELNLNQTHDLAATLAGQAMWVRARRWPSVSASGTAGSTVLSGATAIAESADRPWYIELHPLEGNELPVVGVVEDPRIAHSLGFIHDRFANNPSLAEIAKAVHISPFHFHRLFTRQVGASPKHYLQAKQFQVARWMLRATRAPIGKIAAATGFSSHGHFTSAFHRTVGVSPSVYREQRA